jgi:small basic protein
MWVIIILTAIGFSMGYYLKIPIDLINVKYAALIFLAFMDSFTFGIYHDLNSLPGTNWLVFSRLTVSLVFGGFIIFFGEKSGLDLYLVALLPLTFGLALNLYKFLPK